MTYPSTPEEVEQWNRDVGERIRTARLAQKLTIEELAWQAGMSVSHLKRLQKGERPIMSTYIEAICVALKISPNELLGHKPMPGTAAH
jgi:transcriptional regulator with XRE-family HTH domain